MSDRPHAIDYGRVGDGAAIRVLFDAASIRRRVDELARRIAEAIPDGFTIVGVLKGSFVFVADLARALDRLDRTPRIEFMRLSSYGLAKESSGEVRLVGAPPEVAGQRVLLVDDIEDTGRSLVFAKRLLSEQGALDVLTCVLADKPGRREIEVAADFIGFEVPDVFIVGYGIDFAERYRHLPYIGAVE